MKIIDLLNKWANGEKIPTKICYEGETYFLINNGSYDWYGNDRDGDTSSFLDNIFRVNAFLNDEVEIIEEEEFEDIDLINVTYQDNHNQIEINEYLRTTLTPIIKNPKILIEKLNKNTITQ